MTDEVSHFFWQQRAESKTTEAARVRSESLLDFVDEGVTILVQQIVYEVAFLVLIELRSEYTVRMGVVGAQIEGASHQLALPFAFFFAYEASQIMVSPLLLSPRHLLESQRLIRFYTVLGRC